MPYMLVVVIGLAVVFVVWLVRHLLKTGRAETGDFVAQNVLTRIKAEYRDIH
jgi:hypothetical protein